MSIEATAWALKKADVPDPIAHLVLIGLADHAADDGTGSWPSIATLAKYARCSERSVQRKLRALEEMGTIVQGDQRIVQHVRSDRRPIVWNLPIYGVTVSHPVEVAHGVTAQAPRGDSPVVHGVTAVSPEPSFNHPEPAAARGNDSRPEQINELHAGFAAHAALDSISFTMRAVDVTTVCALVDHHGVQRLVRAALATKTGNVRRATAFIETWSDLKAGFLPSETVTAIGPLCPECADTVARCDVIARDQDPEHRCRGAEDRYDERHTA